MNYRSEVFPRDVIRIKQIVESTSYFNQEEIEIAAELASENADKGDSCGYLFLLLEENDSVVAYTCFGRIGGTASSFDLYWIAVDNDLRGKGLGRKILRETVSEIKRLGGTRIYAETSSVEKYESTRGFYLSSGFYQEAVIKDFYSPGDSKIIYTLEV